MSTRFRILNDQYTSAFVALTIIILVALNCFQASIIKKQKDKIYEVITLNGDVFSNFAKLTELTYNNTDTLMRFTHYLDGHKPEEAQVIGCPECGEARPQTIPESAINNEEIPMDDVPETMDQIVEDVHELNGNIGRLIFSMINMDVGLRITLERLKDPEADVDGLYEKIYKPLSHYGVGNITNSEEM